MRRIKPTTSNLLPYSAERTAALETKTKRSRNTSPTNRLTAEIKAHIERIGGFCLRTNVAGFYREGIGYIKSGSTVGTPDLIAIIGGRFLGIEVKVGKDKQSPDQKSVQAGVEAAGGVYLIARDFESFRAAFDALVKAPFT